MKNVTAKFRLWIDTKNGINVIGDGKWRLLSAIKKNGSLASACKSLDISYRKAWGDLLNVQEASGVLVIEKRRGGKKGGLTVLTEDGEKLVRAYESLHKDIEKAVNTSFARRFRTITK